jgi:hypothetical protein
MQEGFMAGQTWSINIVPGSSGASFVPDVYTESGVPQSALQAQTNDVLSWNNQTPDPHQPWQTDQTFKIGSGPNVPLCDEVAPNKSSEPGYNCSVPTAPGTIYYACKTHPALPEHGTIDVIS